MVFVLMVMVVEVVVFLLLLLFLLVLILMLLLQKIYQSKVKVMISSVVCQCQGMVFGYVQYARRLKVVTIVCIVCGDWEH